jgi:hypothetical protein
MYVYMHMCILYYVCFNSGLLIFDCVGLFDIVFVSRSAVSDSTGWSCVEAAVYIIPCLFRSIGLSFGL